VLAVVLIIAGTLVLADAVVTMVWQEPLSALYAKFRQDSLTAQLRRVEVAAPSRQVERVLASIPDQQRRIEYLAAEARASDAPGAAVGWIRIPAIGAKYVVVDGTGTEELMSGPGVDTETSYPGMSGTTLIAGHRTTYLAPFRHIDSLKVGDAVVLDTPYAHLVYKVTGHAVVLPTAVAFATAQLGYSRLVLSACTPLFSASHRLLVFARLTRTVPLGAARALAGGLVPRQIITTPGAPRAHVRLKVVLKTGDLNVPPAAP
jgi:sortase A